MFVFKKIGDVVLCSGDNFVYRRIGERSRLETRGKIPSLRILKSAIKKIEKLSE